MNEKIIDELLSYMNQTKDFVLKESPELINQILLYEKTWSWFSAIFSLCIIIILITFFIYTFLHPKLESWGSFSTASFMTCFISAAFCIPCFCVFIDSINTLVKIYLAPKYYLINLILNIKN